MAVNRASIVDQNFQDAIAATPEAAAPAHPEAPLRPGSGLTGRRALAILESVVATRHLDLEARELKARNEGFYTIASAGHELNAVVADCSRPTDPAFLHYRSGGFFVHRASQVPGSTPLLDVLLGTVASSDEPMAGGRHKVFGSLALAVPPQTSTIASHLPKAVGAAFTIARRKRLGLTGPGGDDGIVICSFGDASSNHSTACGAFNLAALADHQNLPCPVLFVCEDNGLGISVRTPQGWVESRFRNDPGIKYFGCDGLDLVDAWETARAAVAYVRSTRRPTLLHLRLVRLLGHAGSDVEQLYRSSGEIETDEAQDPVLATARALITGGFASRQQVLELYRETRARVAALGREVVTRPRIESAEEVMAPLAPRDPDAIAAEATRPPEAEARAAFWGRLPEEERPRHMAMLINRGLGDLLVKYPEAILFGEDVARKGGVYHVTADLQKRAGVGRVFNSPLDETSILGMALGSAQMGLLPLPEIQYLAYLHNAVDQLRGEAGSQSFFSQGQVRNPMVVRIAGLAYQKGFGGHFHNDNGVAALLEIPGLVVACPSNGPDAVGMMRSLVAAARLHGQVGVVLEPIALYMTKGLHDDDDGRWLFDYPGPEHHVPIGSARLWTAQDYAVEGGPAVDPEALLDAAPELTIVSFANGLWMSLRVAEQLRRQGRTVEVLDIRWLKPLPEAALLAAAGRSGRVLVVDECRRNSGVADAILALYAELDTPPRLSRITGYDTYIPLGDAANLVLIQEDDILDAAERLLEVE